MLNYTTKIDASKTVGEIQALLSRKGVRKLMIDYDQEGQPIALTFVVDWNGIPTLFALPCRWQGVLNALKKIPAAKKTPDQAIRTGWRIIKDWVEAQMAIIEAEAVSLPEVFLPYAVTKDGGTLYELTTKTRDQLLLPPGA